MAQGRIWFIRTYYGYGFKEYVRWEVPETIAVSLGPVPGALPEQAAALPCTRVKSHGRDRGHQGNGNASRARGIMQMPLTARVPRKAAS